MNNVMIRIKKKISTMKSSPIRSSLLYTRWTLASIKRQKEEAGTKMERKVEEERVTGRRGGVKMLHARRGVFLRVLFHFYWPQENLPRRLL